MTTSPNEQPNYTDILYLIQERDSAIPLNKDVMNSEWSKYPFLLSHKAELVDLFNKHYQFREISAETIERWMRLVTKRFVEVARTYDHAFKVISENIDKLDELGKEIVTDTLWGSEFKDTYQDTPVSPITVGEEYASSINRRERMGKDSVIRKDNTDMYIKEINDLINSFIDLKLRWVNEFESLFMSTIMRV